MEMNSKYAPIVVTLRVRLQKKSSTWSREHFCTNQNYQSLIVNNFGDGEYKGRDAFLQAKSPVYFTSTMEIYDPEIREQLQEYSKRFIYPNNDEIYCSFTYEWSIGNGNEAEIAAAEKLLSWMLGNVYPDLFDDQQGARWTDSFGQNVLFVQNRK